MSSRTRPVAFITGASRGIGKACAIELARVGFDIAISARSVSEGEEREHSSTLAQSNTKPLPGSLNTTAEAARAEGAEILLLPADLLDRKSLEAAAQTLLETWGQVDVVVHNGRYIGPGHMDRFLDTPLELISHQLEANLMAPLVLNIQLVVLLTSPLSQLLPPHPLRSCPRMPLKMLELARATGARLLLSSTSEVYGDPEEHPQTESYRGCVNPIGPRSCYDEGKRVAEPLCFDFHRQYGIEIRVVRIFNTYGPRRHPEDGRVVSNFIRQALHGEPLTLFGEGEQTRCFCYVDDLVEGLVRMMNQEEHTGPINLGNPESPIYLTK